jgi:nucleoside-diphosphate-sugar epimerase
MTDVAFDRAVADPAPIQPASRPNLDKGFNPLTLILFFGILAAGLLYVAYSIYSDVDATGTVYNTGCNGRTDLKELFAMIRDDLAKDDPSLESVEAVFEPPRAGDIPHSQASIDKIAAALGYVPSHDIAEGLAETVDWYVRARPAT